MESLHKWENYWLSLSFLFFLWPVYRGSWNTIIARKWDVGRRKNIIKENIWGTGDDKKYFSSICWVGFILLKFNWPFCMCESDLENQLTGTKLPCYFQTLSSGWEETMTNNPFSYLWGWALFCNSIEGPLCARASFRHLGHRDEWENKAEKQSNFDFIEFAC